MRYNLLLFFTFIWFLRAIFVEYFLGYSADSAASSDPFLYKFFFEGTILLLFISSFKRIKIFRNDLTFIIPILTYLSVAVISSKLNDLPILNAFKYSRYFIYSFILYIVVRSIPLNEYRINLLFKIFKFLFIFQIFISIFNIIIYGPFESRIGSLILMSGELGTTFPLIALSFAIPYYHIISKRRTVLIITWLFLMVGLSTSKRGAIILFPIFYIYFSFIIYKLFNYNYTKQLKVLIYSGFSILIFSPLLYIYINNIYLGSSNFESNNISQLIEFVQEYAYKFNGEYSTGRISTTISLLTSIFDFNQINVFGYGPMILYEESRGYGSGFTLLSIFYGIVGWSRDLISTGIFSVVFFFVFVFYLFRKIKLLFDFKEKLTKNLIVLLVGSYFSTIILIFDYLFYSSVNFVSGFPLFLIMIFLGILENYLRNLKIKF